MTAHVLRDENYDAILTGCKHYFKENFGGILFVGSKRFVLDSEEECNQLGQILKNQNHASVSVGARYKEEIEVSPYKYKVSSKLYSPVELLKICDCYDFQSCETGDYRERTACNIIDNIRFKLITLLPGYDDAKWEV